MRNERPEDVGAMVILDDRRILLRGEPRAHHEREDCAVEASRRYSVSDARHSIPRGLDCVSAISAGAGLPGDGGASAALS